MNFTGIDDPRDLDDFRALEFDFGQVFGRDDHVLFRLELIALDDFLRRQRLAALFAFLLVTDGSVVLLVQLVEPDRLLRVHRVVNADGNGDERELNVPFPDGSHSAPRFPELHFDPGTIVVRPVRFWSMVAFIRCACSMARAAKNQSHKCSNPAEALEIPALAARRPWSRWRIALRKSTSAQPKQSAPPRAASL